MRRFRGGLAPRRADRRRGLVMPHRLGDRPCRGVSIGAPAQTVVTNDKRVALVIGISKYQFAPSLSNPVNDARRVAEALRHLNFEVEESYDAD